MTAMTTPVSLTKDQIGHLGVDELFHRLGSTRQNGLSSQEAAHRFALYGSNALEGRGRSTVSLNRIHGKPDAIRSGMISPSANRIEARTIRPNEVRMIARDVCHVINIH